MLLVGEVFPRAEAVSCARMLFGGAAGMFAQHEVGEDTSASSSTREGKPGV